MAQLTATVTLRGVSLAIFCVRLLCLAHLVAPASSAARGISTSSGPGARGASAAVLRRGPATEPDQAEFTF